MSDNRGSATVELVVIAPLFVVVLGFVIGCGRWVQAGTAVRNAANQAARAASMVSSGRMRQVGLAQASRHLTPGPSGCVGASADVTVRKIGRVSVVRAVARCDVDFRGVLSVFGLPHSVVAVSTEVIDVFTFR